MSTGKHAWIGLLGVGLFCMSIVASGAEAPKLLLWGKQTAGSGHAKNAQVEGNKIELSAPATIVKVEGSAQSYTIWSVASPANPTAKAVMTGGKGKKDLVGQTLAAGTYKVIPALQGMSSARIEITLN